jgi:hypothetical protein
MAKKVLVRNYKTGAVIGSALVIAGAYLIHDAYDKRGRSKPFALKWLPGA